LENATGTEAIQLAAEGTTPLWSPTPESAVEFWGGPAGSVEGTVTAFGTGAPVADCAVWGIGPEDNSDTLLTDASGNYMLRMEPGAGTLYFEHPNYCVETRQVVVEENVPQTQDVQLRAPNPQFSASSMTLVIATGRRDSATFTIRNATGGQCPLDFSISDTSAWLTVIPESGRVNLNQVATIRVRADAHGYPEDTDLNSTMVITYHGAGSPHPIRVDAWVVPDDVTGDPALLLPTEFALRQCYPNPFNPTTQLRFDVPKESRVEIVIYNIMGQEVAHPVSSIYQPGRFGVTFDASHLPSGMYLVRMQSGDFSGVNKMMLLR
jgi:hypothetical protein